jgi:hypothetical protein
VGFSRKKGAKIEDPPTSKALRRASEEEDENEDE